MFHLRSATAEDSKTIKQLVIKGGINPGGLKWHRFIVAESDEGDVIACGQIKTHRDGSPELASIVVRKDLRGQGIARAIIEYLLDRHEGDLYLMCRSGLGGMYAKFGFYGIKGDELPRYFRRVSRMVGVIAFVLPINETLLVMKRPAP